MFSQQGKARNRAKDQPWSRFNADRHYYLSDPDHMVALWRLGKLLNILRKQEGIPGLLTPNPNGLNFMPIEGPTSFCSVCYREIGEGQFTFRTYMKHCKGKPLRVLGPTNLNNLAGGEDCNPSHCGGNSSFQCLEYTGGQAQI